jgi:hypothetical protein
MDKKQQIKKALAFDPLQKAEDLTGKSYKEDESTGFLGMMLQIEHSKRMERLMDSTNDTKFSETEEDYLKKVTDFGFKSLLIIPFKNKNKIEERLHIMFHYDYSILLVWDTHTFGDDGSWAKAGKSVPPPSRNGGKFYYNWIPNNGFKNNCTSSGGCVSNGDKNISYSYMFNPDLTPHILPKELRDIQPKLGDGETYEIFNEKRKTWESLVDKYLSDHPTISIWSGNHDCREALKFNINQLAENGTFVKKWKKQPFLWLLHYMDTEKKDYDYNAINKERIAMLPIEVQELIKGEI